MWKTKQNKIGFVNIKNNVVIGFDNYFNHNINLILKFV